MSVGIYQSGHNNLTGGVNLSCIGMAGDEIQSVFTVRTDKRDLLSFNSDVSLEIQIIALRGRHGQYYAVINENVHSCFQLFVQI